MSETTYDVFLDLLEAWEEAEQNLIHEWSGDFAKDEKHLLGQVRAWRLRYKGAA